MELKYFVNPFAVSGDIRVIPDAQQADGSVSMSTGYTFDYERDPATDPNAKNIGRADMNWLFGVITVALREIQGKGVYPYIPATQNGGAPFPYKKGSWCWYDEGTTVGAFQSLVDNNTSLPTDTAKWQRADLLQSVNPAANSLALRDAGGRLKAETPTSANDVMRLFDKYDLCEFYYFRHPTLKPGFQPANGGLIQNADQLWPKAWAYLQTTEGQKLRKTEVEWQAMVNAVWATLADGTQVGWNGIGGAPFFVQDLSAKTLRLPDLRGMYMEASGKDGLGVAGVGGDQMRQVAGYARVLEGGTTGAFDQPEQEPWFRFFSNEGGNVAVKYFRMRASFVAPIGPAFAPRRWGSLACVYLGLPAS